MALWTAAHEESDREDGSARGWGLRRPKVKERNRIGNQKSGIRNQVTISS
jgi:hypothetical protein